MQEARQRSGCVSHRFTTGNLLLLARGYHLVSRIRRPPNLHAAEHLPIVHPELLGRYLDEVDILLSHILLSVRGGLLLAILIPFHLAFVEPHPHIGVVDIGRVAEFPPLVGEAHSRADLYDGPLSGIGPGLACPALPLFAAHTTRLLSPCHRHHSHQPDPCRTPLSSILTIITLRTLLILCLLPGKSTSNSACHLAIPSLDIPPGRANLLSTQMNSVYNLLGKEYSLSVLGGSENE